jgi:hypothetical protein
MHWWVALLPESFLLPSSLAVTAVLFNPCPVPRTEAGAIVTASSSNIILWHHESVVSCLITAATGKTQGNKEEKHALYSPSCSCNVLGDGLLEVCS